MKRTIQSSGVFLWLSAVVFSPGASAVPVTLAGDSVSFTYDTSLTGLFGTPVVQGDLLYFTPTLFKAEAIGGAGIDASSATFNVTVTAQPGYFLSSIALSEQGDYYKLGSDSSVALGGKLIARDLAAPLVAMSDSITSALPLTTTTSFPSFATTEWNAAANVSLPASIEGINLTLENILLAFSGTWDSAAFIEKKFAGLSIITSPIPETDRAMMMLAGLGLVGFVTWRKRGRFPV